MQTFEIPFDKIEVTSYNPVLGRMVTVKNDPYTPIQYEDLGSRLSLAIGEGFVSFETISNPSTQRVILKYNGPMVEDLEQNRNDEIDTVINTWYEDNL